MTTRRSHLRLLAGAFVGQLLLGDGSAGAQWHAVARRAIGRVGSKWLHTAESGWQKCLDSPMEVNTLWGLRSDNDWFYVVVPRFPDYTETQTKMDLENGWFTMSTFLWPDFGCNPDHRCELHHTLFGSSGAIYREATGDESQSGAHSGYYLREQG